MLDVNDFTNFLRYGKNFDSVMPNLKGRKLNVRDLKLGRDSDRG